MEGEKQIQRDKIWPTWDALGDQAKMSPFFSPNEELKRTEFVASLLANGPRKETENPFSGNRELWFDIEYQGQKHTWIISQIRLLAELKRMAPLTGKKLHVRLVPVDD